MRVRLWDGNLLCALTIDSHIHHSAARRWFAKCPDKFATCAVTQGTLLRIHMSMAEDRSSAAAWATLGRIVELPNHEFWEAGFSYASVPFRHLQGAKQVTDAWLAELARRRKSKLMTFDTALAGLHSDVAELVPFT